MNDLLTRRLTYFLSAAALFAGAHGSAQALTLGGRFCGELHGCQPWLDRRAADPVWRADAEGRVPEYAAHWWRGEH
jgi:hypothetical protein